METARRRYSLEATLTLTVRCHKKAHKQTKNTPKESVFKTKSDYNIQGMTERLLMS